MMINKILFISKNASSVNSKFGTKSEKSDVFIAAHSCIFSAPEPRFQASIVAM